MTDLAIEKVAPYSLGEIARLHMAGELKVAERAYAEYLVENLAKNQGMPTLR